MPSRGIWGGGQYMDISWSGFGVGYDGSGSFDGIGDDGYPHELKNTSGDVRLAAADFIRTLVTPGTKFRFQRDPDAQVYTVQDFTFEEYGYNNLHYWESFADKFTLGRMVYVTQIKVTTKTSIKDIKCVKGGP